MIGNFLQEQRNIFIRKHMNEHHSSSRINESNKEKNYSNRDYQDRSQENNFCIKIACHNINGIKQNKQKIDLLQDWIKEEDIGICGIVETNITSKEGRFLLNKESDYTSI